MAPIAQTLLDYSSEKVYQADLYHQFYSSSYLQGVVSNSDSNAGKNLAIDFRKSLPQYHYWLI